MSAQFWCAELGCGKQVNTNKGLGSYSPEHRPKMRARSAAMNGNGAGTLADGLKTLQTLAKRADRLEAKAAKLTREAQRAAVEAGEARDEFATKLQEITA